MESKYTLYSKVLVVLGGMPLMARVEEITFEYLTSNKYVLEIIPPNSTKHNSEDIFFSELASIHAYEKAILDPTEVLEKLYKDDKEALDELKITFMDGRSLIEYIEKVLNLPVHLLSKLKEKEETEEKSPKEAFHIWGDGFDFEGLGKAMEYIGSTLKDTFGHTVIFKEKYGTARYEMVIPLQEDGATDKEYSDAWYHLYLVVCDACAKYPNFKNELMEDLAYREETVGKQVHDQYWSKGNE